MEIVPINKPNGTMLKNLRTGVTCPDAECKNTSKWINGKCAGVVVTVHPKESIWFKIKRIGRYRWVADLIGYIIQVLSWGRKL
jgi:hypothetical protein